MHRITIEPELQAAAWECTECLWLNDRLMQLSGPSRPMYWLEWACPDHRPLPEALIA